METRNPGRHRWDFEFLDDACGRIALKSPPYGGFRASEGSKCLDHKTHIYDTPTHPRMGRGDRARDCARQCVRPVRTERHRSSRWWSRRWCAGTAVCPCRRSSRPTDQTPRRPTQGVTTHPILISGLSTHGTQLFRRYRP